MQKFIGTKIIKAFPEKLTWKEHYVKRGWLWPEDKKDGNRIGYTVGYSDAEGNFNGQFEGGCEYITWSPADVFESSYKKCEGMSFGLAVEAMKKGLKVARKGWNGKKMFTYIVDGEEINGELLNSSARKHVYPLLTGPTDETRIELRPYFELKTAQNDIAKWAPSGSDALAEDWEIVE